MTYIHADAGPRYEEAQIIIFPIANQQGAAAVPFWDFSKEPTHCDAAKRPEGGEKMPDGIKPDLAPIKCRPDFNSARRDV